MKNVNLKKIEVSKKPDKDIFEAFLKATAAISAIKAGEQSTPESVLRHFLVTEIGGLNPNDLQLYFSDLSTICDDRISRFQNHLWILQKIGLDRLEPAAFYDEDTISNYSELESSAPPIIVLLDENKNQLRVEDGTHRLLAARSQNLKSLDAYLGIPIGRVKQWLKDSDPFVLLHTIKYLLAKKLNLIILDEIAAVRMKQTSVEHLQKLITDLFLEPEPSLGGKETDYNNQLNAWLTKWSLSGLERSFRLFIEQGNLDILYNSIDLEEQVLFFNSKSVTEHWETTVTKSPISTLLEMRLEHLFQAAKLLGN